MKPQPTNRGRALALLLTIAIGLSTRANEGQARSGSSQAGRVKTGAPTSTPTSVIEKDC